MAALTFDDSKKAEFVAAIAGILRVQRAAAGGRCIEDERGNINRRALGYIYGFIDAALRPLGQDMADISIGVPIACNVLEQLFPEPGKAKRSITFLIDHLGRDAMVNQGVMKGGQQWLDFNKPGTKGAPMGFARYLIQGDE